MDNLNNPWLQAFIILSVIFIGKFLIELVWVIDNWLKDRKKND